MNQITIDSALSAQTKGSVPAAVLVEEHNYQALLNIGKDGIGQLKLHTPAGMVLIQDAKLNLPALQGQLMVQLTQALSGQLQLKLSQNGPQPMPVQLTQPQLQQLVTQLSAQISTQPGSQLSTQLTTQLNTQSAAQLHTQASTNLAKVVQVQVQIQRQDQQLILQLGQNKVQLPLPAALQSLPPSQWLDAKLQLKAGQLSLVLPKAALLPHSVDTTQGKNSGPLSAKAPELLTVPLKSEPTSGQIKTQPQPAVSSPTAAPTKTPAAGSAQQQTIIPLSAAVQQRVLPLVLPQLTNAASGTVLSLNELKQLPIPLAMKQQLADPQYQLQLTPQGQLQLKAIPEQKTIQIDPQPKVLQLQSSKTEPSQAVSGSVEATKFIKPQIEPAVLNQAWRQLLPMLNPEWENLAEVPELPEAVKAILQLVRQSQPDASKLTNLTQLPAQLQALLQFNPLQNVTMPQTAAGTLAVAIQLLLGRLGQSLPQNDKGPNKDHKLKEFVAQLDQTQSSQLLKQLSSQSSSLQQAQLATLEQQSKDPLQQIFLTLPIQNQQVSDFCQIAITQQEEEQEKGKGKSTQWQLSMKFDLKQLGQLLAISKLSGSSLSLQLYTDTTMLKLLAEKYLPLLKDRCKAQGIEVTEAHCQLGKIPDSLMPKTTSLLAIRV
ncbi:flagellar hook-length control protein FliK [Rheinheimera soli]|uniref:flagellar hook-length control protein FliK n=1 Tax=Rheinheimera soli TaxID=443616 RepID=UPI001E37C614|nr:flagellar hook-length control protein FliK [Rheinheimera soli]